MKYILATDLDRTLLPNGKDIYQEGSIEKLILAIGESDIGLVYVTGRNLRLVEEAMIEYKIPLPLFLVAEVGSMVYKKEDEILVADDNWLEYLSQKTPGWERGEIEQVMLEELGEGARLQEAEFQNNYKVSYYLTGDESIFQKVEKLKANSVLKEMQAELVYSFDPLKKTGLLDVLPKVATKVTALEFVRGQLGLEVDSIIYAGDSGNDILPLSFGYKAIVVKNADAETKESLLKLIKEKDLTLVYKIYFATGDGVENGNYASGIIEGLKYFDLI